MINSRCVETRGLSYNSMNNIFFFSDEENFEDAPTEEKKIEEIKEKLMFKEEEEKIETFEIPNHVHEFKGEYCVFVLELAEFTGLTRKYGPCHFASITARMRQLLFPYLEEFNSVKNNTIYILIFFFWRGDFK